MDIRRGIAGRLAPAMVVAVVLAGGCASTEGAAVVPTTSSAPAPSAPASTTTTVAGLGPPPSVIEFRAPCPAQPTSAGGLVGLEDLASHEALWQASRPESYRYQLDVGGGERSIGRTTVEVADGVAAPDPSTTLVAHLGLEDLTIESWFAYLRALDEGELEQPDAVLVTWDAERGFPTAIQLDPICNAIDDELAITLSGFEAGVG